MGYFAAYWEQIKDFYRTVGKAVFARRRNLDGPLGDFVMRKGYLWEFLDLHIWLVKLIGRFFFTLANLIIGYGVMLIICVLLTISPLLILLVSPIFTYHRFKQLKEKGDAL